MEPTRSSHPQSKKKPHPAWWVFVGLIAIGLVGRLADLRSDPGAPNSPHTEGSQSRATTPSGTVTNIDRAAALALSATDWPNNMKVVGAVREGIHEIHKVCPAFPVETIGQGLALKYNTPWDTFVQKAKQLGEPTEAVAVAALHFTHAAMILDLEKSGCGPQPTADAQAPNTGHTASRAQAVASREEPRKLSKEERETMTEGGLLITKTLEDWAYAPKRFRAEAAWVIVDADLNHPIERYPDTAIRSYARAVASCVDGVTNETLNADLTTVIVMNVVHRCHAVLKKRWDFGPVFGPGSSIADRH